MIKSFLSLASVLCITGAIAQNNPDVFLADLSTSEDEETTISNLQNISKDPGYDNQPSFGTGNMLLFSGNNNGQSDIYQYHTRLGRKLLVGGSPGGGEYSPMLSPDEKSISAVRLDTTGLQRLYLYSDDDSKVLIPDLVVAYYTYYDKDRIVGSFIDNDNLNLFVHNLNTNKTDTLLTGVGRSFHKVPGQEAVSYTTINDQERQDVYLLDMQTMESFFVTQLPIGVSDYAWLNDSKIIIGSNSSLFVYDTFGGEQWQKLVDLDANTITNITRIAVSPTGSRIALVGEIPK